MVNSNNCLDLGIVVIGRNEGQRLVDCLASARLVCSTIIYVDSGSNDGSPIRAADAGAQVINLDSIRPFTAARARNEGFYALRTFYPDKRFVQFIDGDCTLNPSWVHQAYEFMVLRPEVAVAFGRRKERFPTASIFNQLCDIEWDTPIGQAESCGGDALIRVDALQAIGGYKSGLIAGEEPELCVRLRESGWSIWRIDADMTTHDAAMTRVGQWWRRAVRCGHAYAEVSALHQNSQFGIWKRETRRALIWGGALPLSIFILGIVKPFLLLTSVVYMLQIIRVVAARPPHTKQSWAYAVSVTAAKFPELQGILKYYFERLRKLTPSVIEYK